MDRDPTKTLVVERSRIQCGQTISGKYRIIRELGQGGMGVVYEAEDLRLKRSVALKFLPPALTADADARERFIREAQAASALDHPHICTIHEIDEAEAGGMYIAMACYTGESLKEKMKRGPLDPAEAVELALQVADGLAKAHEQGIVHRDIKPANIMITADGVAKILDFGLAKLAGEARLTRTGTTMGTVAYMSPEQGRGEDVDVRTDVWSLGIVLYEMATGYLPFGQDKETAVLHAILHEPPRPANLRPGYPDEFAAIIRRALTKEPSKRFPSAREMADELRDLKLRMSVRELSKAGRLTFRRSRRRLWLAAGALVLAGLAAAVWLLTRPHIAFESRDKLMVADADNLTGDKIFDLALRTAIEAGLTQSPYAAVFDRSQIRETLRLMRLDPASRVDENLGYDVCRFGGVRAFILPRIRSAGKAYELEAILVDPLRRRHVARIQVKSNGREDVLLKGVDKLSREVRSRLGESLNSIEKATVSVAKVTTSSWEALDYYSMAQARRDATKYKEAAALYQLALEQDPHFFAAQGALGLIQVQFLDQAERGKEMLRGALREAQSQGAPESQIQGFKALNRQFVDGDLEAALAEFRTMMNLFPDLMPPANNAGMILQALGRYDEAAAMFDEAAKRGPKNSIPLHNLYYLQLNFRKDAAASESAARRLVELAPGLAMTHNSLGYCLAVQEKFREAESELRKALEIEPEHAYALANLGHVLFAAGWAKEAVPIYRRVLELDAAGKTAGWPEWDCVALAMALRESGQVEEAKKATAQGRDLTTKRLKGRPPKAEDWLAFAGLAAVGGDTDRALIYIDRAAPAVIKDADSLMDLAQIYALLGRPGPAIEHIKKSLAAGFDDPLFPVILPEFQVLRKHPEFRALFKLGV
jgi:eukaryotic-like serine/threonine-protein kinase